MNIGVDVIAIKKFRTLKEGDYLRWEHVFTEEEWSYAFKDELSALHLAGIYAAKEATMKATRMIGAQNLRTFTISHTKDGAPILAGGEGTISISHDAGVAVAVALVT